MGYLPNKYSWTLLFNVLILESLNEIWASFDIFALQDSEMTLKLFNVWVIYQINTLEHSMLSFFLILESLNEIWTSFDIFALQCYNKRQGRKLRPVWWQNTLQKRWNKLKYDHQNSGKWCADLPSWSVCCRHCTAKTGNVIINCHLTGGRHEKVLTLQTLSHTSARQEKFCRGYLMRFSVVCSLIDNDTCFLQFIKVIKMLWTQEA